MARMISIDEFRWKSFLYLEVLVGKSLENEDRMNIQNICS